MVLKSMTTKHQDRVKTLAEYYFSCLQIKLFLG